MAIDDRWLLNLIGDWIICGLRFAFEWLIIDSSFIGSKVLLCALKGVSRNSWEDHIAVGPVGLKIEEVTSSPTKE